MKVYGYRFGPCVFIAAGLLLVAPSVAPDYWDMGLTGLAGTLLVGVALAAVGAAGLSLRRPIATGLWAVAPWSLGLTGFPYVGALFLGLEVVASGLVLGFALRERHISVLQAIALAALLRGLSFSGLSVGRLLPELSR